MSTDPPDDEPTDDTTEATEANPTERANELIGTETLWSGQLLYTGAQLGLFEALEEEPMPVDELAERLDTHADTTYRVLRALAHFEVIEEHEG